jgi:alkaline phosphatase
MAKAYRTTTAPFMVLSILAAAGCEPARDAIASDADAALPRRDVAAAVRIDLQDTSQVRNIILMIADGAGPGTWTAAVYGAESELEVRRMPVMGLMDTRSSSSKVTDSAAGATVLATGERVTNRTIGMGGDCPLPSSRDTVAVAWPDGCVPIETWFEIARAKGKATGVVTTTNVIDATPASFVAHSPSRYWRQELAVQFAGAGLDVMMGGGRSYFAGETRSDGRDLLGELCARSDCLWTSAELTAYVAGDRPVVGLFSPADMDDFDPRPVALPDMVGAALAKLELNTNGFVALFETEATDNSQHDNMPLERVTADILEFDRAVGIALDFAERTPGTLVIVTADHETGGFSLVETGRDFRLEYATGGHTATLVPLFAAGPQASRFGGLRDNIEIGRLFMEIVAAM